MSVASRLLVLAFVAGLAACSGTAEPTGSPSPTTSAPVASPPTVAPSPSAPPPTADCSGALVDLDPPDFEGLPEPTAATARLLLDAARRCDEQLLVTAATEARTELTFGALDPATFLSLPEREDEPVYGIVARLLGGTTTTLSAGGDVWVWPAVTTGEGTDADWQSLVSAGLSTQEQVDALRSSGDGYLGWRLGIDADGNWRFLVAGD